MKTEIINITPQIAADLLRHNGSNRKIRPNRVMVLKSAFLRGEYVMTHQGIAFDVDGNFIDGQHRLTAISQLSSGVFPMLVTYGLLKESFSAIDVGIKRTISDALQLDRRVVESAVLLCRFAGNAAGRGAITTEQVRPFVDAIASDHAELMTAYAGATKTWTSSPVRAAAILSMRKGIDLDYIKQTYRNLAARDLDSMNPVSRAFFKAEAAGQVSARFALDMMTRSLTVFDPKKAMMQRIVVHSSESTIEAIKISFADIIASQAPTIIKAEKKATPLSVAKGVSQPDYFTAAG